MRHAALIIPGLLPCALLVACSAIEGEPPQADVRMPAGWTAASAVRGPVVARWWTHFGDATLNGLVQEAIANNRGLRATAERVAMAAAQARVAGAERWPSVGSGFKTQRQRQVFVGFPIPGVGGAPASNTFSSFGLSLDVSWELDLWGRLRTKQAAAAHDADAAMDDGAAAALSLAGQVCKVWFALAEARAQLALAERTVTNFERTLTTVEGRVRAGTRPAIDIHLSRAQLASARVDPELRADLHDRARRQLELLLGRYPQGAITGADLPRLASAPPAGLPAEILGRRPDLRALEKRMLAAHARVGEARANLYPRIALTGSAGTVGGGLADLLDGDFQVWSLFGNLVQPVFQGGRLHAAIEGREASRREDLALFVEGVLRAFGEVEGALAASDFLAKQRAAIDELVTESEAARGVSVERYRGGRGSLLEVLDAERSNVSAQSRGLAVRRQELENRVDLHLALGGSFAEPQPDSVPDMNPDNEEGSKR